VPAKGDRILAALSGRSSSWPEPQARAPTVTDHPPTPAASEISGPGRLLHPNTKVVVSPIRMYERFDRAARLVRDPYVAAPITRKHAARGVHPGDMPAAASDKLIDSLVLHGNPGQSWTDARQPAAGRQRNKSESRLSQQTEAGHRMASFRAIRRCSRKK